MALDDALRVQMVLAVLLVPAVICTMTAALIATPLGWAGSWPGSGPVLPMVTLTTFPIIGLNAAVMAKRARHYFLRDPDRFFGQDPSAASVTG